MAGCATTLLVWMVATGVLFWIGSGAGLETTAVVVVGGVLACLVSQTIVWLLTRARQHKVAAEYARRFGPLPEEFRARGTRVGGSVGRVVGGSTGYLVGGLLGAAADLHEEKKRAEGMSPEQLALLHELGRLGLVRPVLMSLLMAGALLASWVLVVVFEMAKTILFA